SSLVSKANLGIAPGKRGVPVSGHLSADYNGRADTINLGKSFLNLPHTRVDLSGSLGKRVDVHLVSRNLSDFDPVAKLPVTLNSGGAADVTAAVSGSLSAPQITGHASVTNFAADGRQFNTLVADLAASKSGATVSNGAL